MRILIITQYFWPEVFRINELVLSLVMRGALVNILTGQPNYPDGVILPGYNAWGMNKQSWGGAHILRVPLFPRGRKSGLRLALNYFSFVISTLLFGFIRLPFKKADVILVYAPSPLLQALPALFWGRLRGIPVVLYVQDLWPDSIEATGYIKSRFIIRIVKALVSFIYKHSDVILVSSKPFKDIVQSYGTKAKIIYYPNSVDSSFSDPEL